MNASVRVGAYRSRPAAELLQSLVPAKRSARNGKLRALEKTTNDEACDPIHTYDVGKDYFEGGGDRRHGGRSRRKRFSRTGCAKSCGNLP